MKPTLKYMGIPALLAALFATNVGADEPVPSSSPQADCDLKDETLGNEEFGICLRKIMEKEGLQEIPVTRYDDLSEQDRATLDAITKEQHSPNP